MVFPEKNTNRKHKKKKKNWLTEVWKRMMANDKPLQTKLRTSETRIGRTHEGGKPMKSRGGDRTGIKTNVRVTYT